MAFSLRPLPSQGIKQLLSLPLWLGLVTTCTTITAGRLHRVTRKKRMEDDALAKGLTKQTEAPARGLWRLAGQGAPQHPCLSLLSHHTRWSLLCQVPSTSGTGSWKKLGQPSDALSSLPTSPFGWDAEGSKTPGTSLKTLSAPPPCCQDTAWDRRGLPQNPLACSLCKMGMVQPCLLELASAYKHPLPRLILVLTHWSGIRGSSG